MDLIQLKKISIILKNVKTNYQRGETIIGSVNIALNGELDLSRVNIVLRAMSEVKWVENYGPSYKKGYVFRDSEEYLNDVYVLPNNLSITRISAGEHSIPFEFKLPDDITSSIESFYGFIKYWIEANINDYSFEQEVECEKKYFEVESPLRHGLYLSVGGCTGGVVALDLRAQSANICLNAYVDRKGYISGDTVEVHCLVTNTSSVAVTPRASFYKLEIFMAKEFHKTLESSSEQRDGEKVNAGENRDQIISITIPKEMPLSIKTRLITIKYFIRVTLNIPHSLDLHLTLPLIITNEYALNDKNS